MALRISDTAERASGVVKICGGVLRGGRWLAARALRAEPLRVSGKAAYRYRMTAAIRLEVAAERVAAMTVKELKRLADPDEVWTLAHRIGVPFHKLDRLIKRERFKRGLVKMTDLPPHERRELVDRDNLDLHTIASGPIMDASEIYLPAGKLSMAETRAREAAQMLAASGMEAPSGGETGTGSTEGDSPAPKGDAR